MAIDSNDLLKVSVEIPQIFDKLPVLPDHRLSAKYRSNMHLSGVNLHNIAHYQRFVLLGEDNNLIFL